MSDLRTRAFDIQTALAMVASNISLILVHEHPAADRDTAEGVDVTERAIAAMFALQTAIEDFRDLTIDLEIGRVEGAINSSDPGAIAPLEVPS